MAFSYRCHFDRTCPCYSLLIHLTLVGNGSPVMGGEKGGVGDSIHGREVFLRGAAVLERDEASLSVS